HGFIEPDVLFIDATHVKASANKNKYVKQIVQEQSRKYQDQLDESRKYQDQLDGVPPTKRGKRTLRGSTSVADTTRKRLLKNGCPLLKVPQMVSIGTNSILARPFST
ncbi:hypothetical protein P7H02_20580, partial [Paenibacillus larvae]|nr:hypothetical protein [Paenibacillus larvae]MDT2182661.1 hypothetical protein [Paenibacillus larvae]MDT2198828.1 hypothetical protein [Paenibacillus larvae]MDT2208277.1 hypothetical protein [Paenibacillus larvae]